MKRGEKDGNGGQRETGTRGEEECCAAEKQIAEESVARIRHTEKAGRKDRHVQKEGQAAHFPFTGKTQPVLKREDGVVALAAVW